MSRRAAYTLAAGAVALALALSAPVVAGWAVPGPGIGRATADQLTAPAALSARDVSTTGVTLSWSAPASGPTPERWVVRRDGAVVTSCASGSPSAPSCTDSGLRPDTSYTYTVAGALQGWTGPQSAAATVRTQAAAPVDTTAPQVLSLVRAGSSPTAAGSVAWTATFSEPVTGVDTSDFAVTVTGLTGTPAVTAVSGSGSTYTVTASTGAGSGTVQLVAQDDDSVADAAGNALGGPGTGNGGLAGQTYELDRSAPTVTVNQRSGQADPARTVPLLWTVTFSEPVTGFDATDLVRSGTTTGGTVSVTGSGATYEVALAGTPTNGTTAFRVPAGGASDALGHPNAASTSTDASITYDTVAPSVLTASKGDAQGSAQKERFSGTTSEGTGALTVHVYPASGTTVVESYPVGSFSGSSTPFGWSVETSPQDLAKGVSYRFEVVHVDAAGNSSTVFSGGTFLGN